MAVPGCITSVDVWLEDLRSTRSRINLSFLLLLLFEKGGPSIYLPWAMHSLFELSKMASVWRVLNISILPVGSVPGDKYLVVQSISKADCMRRSLVNLKMSSIRHGSGRACGGIARNRASKNRSVSLPTSAILQNSGMC